MPKPRNKESVQGAYFRWLLGRRNGVWQADGRSNKYDPGRHSLGTKDRTEAIRLLQELDLTMAVELGLADPSVIKQKNSRLIPLEEGRQKYLDHVSRPAVLGGVAPRTVKRYKAVLDKFVVFAERNQTRHWQQVNNALVEKYGRWLDDQDYAGRSLYLEVVTLKQAIKWMVGEDLLPATHLVTTKVSKVRGTDT